MDTVCMETVKGLIYIYKIYTIETNTTYVEKFPIEKSLFPHATKSN